MRQRRGRRHADVHHHVPADREPELRRGELVGDFTYLLNVSGAQDGVTEGDVVKTEVAGNVITAYLNGTAMGSAVDDTYTGGNPGMGMNLETGDATCVGTNGNYGFTRYTATAGP